MIKDYVASTQSWPEVQDWLLTSFNCQIGTTIKNYCKDSPCKLTVVIMWVVSQITLKNEARFRWLYETVVQWSFHPIVI